LDGTIQLLVYADAINLLGDNIMKKKTETLIDAGWNIVLEVNTQETKYMLMFHH
jgi:hypothetical protein